VIAWERFESLVKSAAKMGTSHTRLLGLTQQPADKGGDDAEQIAEQPDKKTIETIQFFMRVG
jgi:hypothetical protein